MTSDPPPSARAAAPELAPAAIPECWRRIGVFGDGSCAELARHIHCRNCPVYARAGASLLNRPAPADYRREWAAHYARAHAGARTADRATRTALPVPGSESRLSVTLFRLGPEWLALDTTLFQEVAEHRPMHTLPHRQRGVVLGLVNVRGELLLCVSLGRLLDLQHELPRIRPREGYRRLLVVHADTHRFAFPVDDVYGIHRFHRAELEEPPATVAHASRSFTRGVFRWTTRPGHGRPAREHTLGYLDAEALCHHLDRSLT